MKSRFALLVLFSFLVLIAVSFVGQQHNALAQCVNSRGESIPCDGGAPAPADSGDSGVTPISPLVDVPSDGPCSVVSSTGVNINVRASASTSAAVVSTLNPAETYEVVGSTESNGDTWYELEDPEGFVAAFVVVTGGDCAEITGVSAVDSEAGDLLVVTRSLDSLSYCIADAERTTFCASELPEDVPSWGLLGVVILCSADGDECGEALAAPMFPVITPEGVMMANATPYNNENVPPADETVVLVRSVRVAGMAPTNYYLSLDDMMGDGDGWTAPDEFDPCALNEACGDLLVEVEAPGDFSACVADAENTTFCAEDEDDAIEVLAALSLCFADGDECGEVLGAPAFPTLVDGEVVMPAAETFDNENVPSADGTIVLVRGVNVGGGAAQRYYLSLGD